MFAVRVNSIFRACASLRCFFYFEMGVCENIELRVLVLRETFVNARAGSKDVWELLKRIYLGDFIFFAERVECVFAFGVRCGLKGWINL